MILEAIRAALVSADIQWTVDGVRRTPDLIDIQDAMDEIAVRLLDANIGDRLSVGGLVVEKRPVGHDVYVYLGKYT